MANTPKPKTDSEILAEAMVEIAPIVVDLFNGDIWTRSEEEIATAQKALAKHLEVMKTVARAFDETLVGLRKNGQAFETVEHFRKPRESKADSQRSIVDLLK